MAVEGRLDAKKRVAVMICAHVTSFTSRQHTLVHPGRTQGDTSLGAFLAVGAGDLGRGARLVAQALISCFESLATLVARDAASRCPSARSMAPPPREPLKLSRRESRRLAWLSQTKNLNTHKRAYAVDKASACACGESLNHDLSMAKRRSVGEDLRCMMSLT